MTALLLPRTHADDEPELLYRIKADEEGKRRIEDGLSLQLMLLLALGTDGMKRAAETNSLPSDALAESVRSTLDLGIFSGIGLAEDQLAIADLSVNRQQVGAMQGQWVDYTTLATIGLINTTSSRLVREKLTEMQEGGYSLAWLEEQLLEGFGEQRAEKIAITEVTRSFVWGSVAAYLATNVIDYVMWVTQNDEATCRICQPLHMRVRPIGEGFGLIGFPPAHPNCRCFVTGVINYQPER